MTPTVVLTSSDRCDRCGARAYVLLGVSVAGGGERELTLCAHDFRKHESKLQKSGVRILIDQRRELQMESSPV
jgi:hypothetical protein